MGSGLRYRRPCSQSKGAFVEKAEAMKVHIISDLPDWAIFHIDAIPEQVFEETCPKINSVS